MTLIERIWYSIVWGLITLGASCELLMCTKYTYRKDKKMFLVCLNIGTLALLIAMFVGYYYHKKTGQ